MMTFRTRMTLSALLLLASGLAACAADPTSSLDRASREKVSADVDTTPRAPTIPWTTVQRAAASTQPSH
jgi:hypothetical protein